MSATAKEVEVEDGDEATAFSWPITCDIPYEVLAKKIAEYCHELNARELQMREYQLKRAEEVWPDLAKALDERGKKLQWLHRPPVMPEWADEPVVPLKGHYKKPKTKAEAWRIACVYGHSGWAKVSDLWLWLVDAGPIMEKTMAEYGYLMPRTKK